MTCGEGCRCSSDPALLWLWRRPDWTPSLGTSIRQKKWQKDKNKKTQNTGLNIRGGGGGCPRERLLLRFLESLPLSTLPCIKTKELRFQVVKQSVRQRNCHFWWLQAPGETGERGENLETLRTQQKLDKANIILVWGYVLIQSTRTTKIKTKPKYGKNNK